MGSIWEAPKRPNTMLVQSAENPAAGRADRDDSVPDDPRYRALERAVWRSLHLAGGNPGVAIRAGVRRLAQLMWQAERIRAIETSPTRLDAMERSLARAEKSLARIVLQRRLARPAKPKGSRPTLVESLTAAPKPQPKGVEPTKPAAEPEQPAKKSFPLN
jgi:hypothetical protein